MADATGIMVLGRTFWKSAVNAVGPAKVRRDFHAGVSLGFWLDAWDRSTLFQDTAGAVPVTEDGQSVALWLDKSGNGYNARQADAGARPIWRTDGTQSWLEFDGVSTFLQVPMAGNDFYDRSIVAAVRITGGDTRKTIAEGYGNASAYRAVQIEVNNATLRAIYDDTGTDTTLTDSTTLPLGQDRIVAMTLDGSAPNINTSSLRKAGAVVASDINVITDPPPIAGVNIFVNRDGIAGGRRAGGRLYNLAYVPAFRNVAPIEQVFAARLGLS